MKRARGFVEGLGRFVRLVYMKIVRIHDTPQRVALGLSLGVFIGIMPFAGPVLSVFLAVLLKVNRASAFIGALLTNAWITFIAFLLSIKIGSFIFGVDAAVIHERWTALLKDFHMSNFFKASFVQIALPVITGYLALALFAAAAAYVLAIAVIKLARPAGGRRKAG